MIAKRVMSPKGGSGYQRLSGYVLNVAQEYREATDPASWTRLGAYILDADHHGEKVAWARATNCGNDDPGWAVRVILSTQAQNTRAQADKSYHLVVSFPEGERPTREQIEDIEDRLCERIGFGDHQRVSAVHQNTDNWHLHIAINKVHPTTLRNITPHQDHFRLQAACQELEIKHGLTQERHTVSHEQSRERQTRGRAADFEARHGGQSFLAWTQANAKAPLLAARDSGQGWDALHEAAAAHGLTLKLRGAGLVIGHSDDSRLHVKASDVDRGLSLKALTDRLGPFQPRGEQAQGQDAKPQTRYERPTPQGSLYEAFQRERDATVMARDEALAKLAEQHKASAKAMSDWHRQQVKQQWDQKQPAYARRGTLQFLAEQKKKDRERRTAHEREERRHVRSLYPAPNWQGYLEAQAANGNEDALKALRARQIRTQRIEDAVLTAENAADARHVIDRNMQPVIRRDGRVIYRINDGGMVSDEAAQIRVPQSSTAATALALSLAAERFGHRPLIVNGSDEFKARVATVAAKHGMAVTFADRTIEQKRIETRNQMQKTVDKGQSRTQNKGNDHSKDGGLER